MSMLSEQAENHYSGSLVDAIGNRNTLRKSIVKNSELGDSLRRTANDIKGMEKMAPSSY